MFNIESFLKKHSNKINNDNLIYDVVLEYIKKETDILLNKEDINILKWNLIIKTTPLKKNKIILKKDVLLKKISNLGIKDIK